MKVNVGERDRLIRFFVGGMIVGAGLYLQSWWGLLGLVPAASALVRFCPAYALLGLSTCARKA